MTGPKSARGPNAVAKFLRPRSVAIVGMSSRAGSAGQNILRAIAGRPLEPFRYKDYGIMATIGRGAAVADIFGLKIAGPFPWLV